MDVLNWIVNHFWTVTLPVLVLLVLAEGVWITWGLPWWRKAVVLIVDLVLISVVLGFTLAATDIPPDPPTPPAPTYRLTCHTTTYFGAPGTLVQNRPIKVYLGKGLTSLSFVNGCNFELFPAGEPVTEEWSTW